MDQCVYAAIDNGNFIVFIDLGRDLTITQNLVVSVTQILENIGSARAVIEKEEL